jgi:GT2 family glycosyltransferase
MPNERSRLSPRYRFPPMARLAWLGGDEAGPSGDKYQLSNRFSDVSRSEAEEIADSGRRSFMQRGSVLVLNYNGKHLLEKNLESVTVAADYAKCETAVIDNGSYDDSVKFIKKNFPKVKLISLEQNYGYAEGNNRAAKLVKNNIVILLNNDVIPEKNSFKLLVDQFRNDMVFAVSSRQVVKTSQGDFLGGIAAAKFSKGLLRHHPVEISSRKVIHQLYASGGAAAFDRKKFLVLGGFDSLYAPFYWEDADLSVRAWAQGWKVLFDPRSVVEHRHESTVKRVFPGWYVKAIGDRNMFLFNWRHVNGQKYWLKHILWLPLHIVRRPLGFLLALPKIPAIIKRRLKEPRQIDLDKLLSMN